MTKINENITLVMATDNHYLIMLAALIKSIELSYKGNALIDIWVIETDVTRKNKSKLEKSINTDKIKIHWINSKEAIPKGMHLPLDKNTYPLNIFMRLFIPYFLPENIKKALYLDVDMLVLEDIEKLWNIDITDYVAGAVVDSICKVAHIGIKNYQDFDMDAQTPYFNSGLLLMNLDLWRQKNITPKVIDCVNRNRNYATFSDQYGLNVVLYQQWKQIDPLWNYYSSGDLKYPYLIHFFHRKPFYTTYSYNKDYQNLFYKYLNQTEWKNTPQVGESKRYFVKIRNLIEKIPLLFKNQ